MMATAEKDSLATYKFPRESTAIPSVVFKAILCLSSRYKICTEVGLLPAASSQLSDELGFTLKRRGVRRR